MATPRFDLRIDGYADLTVLGRGGLRMNQAREYIRDDLARLGHPLEVDVIYKDTIAPVHNDHGPAPVHYAH